MVKKTIGKNTLGDNNKMKVAMRDYERSTHNLSYIWRNTQAPGTLVPCMKILATPGTTYKIKANSHILTHPTVGPLFGSYKFQVDIFTVPIRLYNALLHNNALNVGLDMAKVKFPKFAITLGKDSSKTPWSSSSLLTYLGFRNKGRELSDSLDFTHKFNAIPAIAYYDIFKNYYANKQEEKFYTIGVGDVTEVQNPTTTSSPIRVMAEALVGSEQNWELVTNSFMNLYYAENKIVQYVIEIADTVFPSDGDINQLILIGEYLSDATNVIGTFEITAKQMAGNAALSYNNQVWSIPVNWHDKPEYRNIRLTGVKTSGSIKLNEYELEQIDKTREEILSLGSQEGLIQHETGKGNITQKYLKDLINLGREFYSAYPQVGLAIKTYQSDIFNNWINTEWIDGENGINAITAVDVSDGKLELDTLILAKKVYNMLNRIAISGGTYNDWIETVYTTDYVSRSEIPEYQGGMSSEIQFQEVVSNSATENEPLGTLAGRGINTGKKGGDITVKVSEPCYLIGICSITPRVDYSQGNDFDIMLDNLDQIHKPQLDQIGFQDLLTWKMDAEQIVYANGVLKEYSVGKQPAWIDYMTNYNKTYGNFAVGEPEAFMVLNRIYKTEWEGNTPKINNSTYIDPQSYNYVFADTDLQSMNFWVQIGFDIEARIVMSAKVMPTL
jgi:hypothetical protein